MGSEVLLRAVGFTMLLPVGRGSWGGISRIFLGVLIGLLFLQKLTEPAFHSFVVEPTVGLLCALPFLVQLAVVSMIAELFQMGRGETIANLYDPSAKVSSGSAVLIARVGFIAAYLGCEGAEHLMMGFKRSLELLPLAAGSVSLTQLGELSVQLVMQSFSLTLTLVMPLLFVFLGGQIVTAFLARIVPRIEGITVAFLINGLLAAVLLLYLAADQQRRVFVNSILYGLKGTL